MFYHSSTFDFSKKSKSFIVKKFQDRFTNDFFHDLDITQYDTDKQREWLDSCVGEELCSFLQKYNLTLEHMGICFFISNHNEWYRGNPHIDMKFGPDSIEKISSRFNVLILGNPADEYIWWGHCDYSSSNLEVQQYTSINGLKYETKSIPGSNIDERWRFLGNPSLRTKRVLTPSAFVKTDCAHTVHVSKGPRLILTAGFKEKLEDIIRQ